MTKEKTFVRITNKDVYERLGSIEQKLDNHLRKSAQRDTHIKYLTGWLAALTSAVSGAFLYLINKITP